VEAVLDYGQEVLMDSKKGLLLLGLAAGGILLASKLRAAELPPPEGNAASIGIVILDAAGNIVPHNFPADLYEGETYTIRVSVTNKSTKAGNPCAAVLTVANTTTLDGIGVTPGEPWPANYSSGQTLIFDYTLAIPDGSAGKFGALYFYVNDPGGNQLASAYENVNILAHVLSATINPGVIYDAALGRWVRITDGMPIGYGLENVLSPEWINNSDIPIAGHVTLRVTYPDGSSIDLAATQFQDRVADPMDGWLVEFEPFITSQEGTYILTARLFELSTMTELDSIEFTLVVAAQIIGELPGPFVGSLYRTTYPVGEYRTLLLFSMIII